MLLASEAKLSTHRYYNVLIRQTNTVLPHLVPKRYREFLRVQHQCVHLQDLKHAGSQDPLLPNSLRGDLALHCPVCPRDFGRVSGLPDSRVLRAKIPAKTGMRVRVRVPEWQNVRQNPGGNPAESGK
jgi:hypothetical protein